MKEQVYHRKEIARRDVFGMILEKERPDLTRRMRTARPQDVLLNSRRADLNIELEEVATNAFCSPKQIHLGHLLNQGHSYSGQPGPTATITKFHFAEQPTALPTPM